MTAGIYKIINKINGKYYLGSSQDINRRWTIHKNCLNLDCHINIYLQRAWNKYGADNFYLEIVLVCDGYFAEQILAVEQIYLDNLDKNSYNLSKYAGGGDNISYHPDRENIIKKISDAGKKRFESMTDEEWQQLCESRMGDKNGMFGKTHTSESRKKISDAIAAYNLDHDSYRKGKTFDELFSPTESARLKKLLSHSASARTDDKNAFFGKKHSNETKQIIREAREGTYYGSQNTPLIINNIYYKSLGEAAKALNIPITTIRWRVLSKSKKYDNYSYADKRND